MNEFCKQKLFLLCKKAVFLQYQFLKGFFLKGYILFITKFIGSSPNFNDASPNIEI
jgi:hypothetical protein